MTMGENDLYVIRYVGGWVIRGIPETCVYYYEGTKCVYLYAIIPTDPYPH